MSPNDKKAVANALKPRPGDDDPDNMPDFRIAYGLVDLPFSNPETKQVEYFPSMSMSIPVYRHPEYILLTAVFPLFILNIFTIASFRLEHEDFSGRLSIVITILLALFAFLPTFHQETPFATITSLDVCMFGSVMIMAFVLFESLFIRSSAHGLYIFPAVSVALLVAGVGYFLVKYIIFRKGKGKWDAFKGNAEKRYSTAFDHSLWHVVFSPKDYVYRADPTGFVIKNELE